MRRTVKIMTTLLLFSLLAATSLFADDSARITPVVKVIREWSSAVVNIGTEQIVLLFLSGGGGRGGGGGGFSGGFGGFGGGMSGGGGAGGDF